MATAIQKMKAAEQHKRNISLANPVVRASHAKRRKLMPLVVNVDKGHPMMIPAIKLETLGIDERYQRREIRPHVNSIIHAMTGGGVVPDPIKLARRPDGSLWIVDGQQRYWAHVRLQRQISAMVFDVSDFETERALFTILNTRKEVGAAYQVNAWNGETAEIIRRLNSKPDSVFYGQIDLGGAHHRPFPSTILVRIIATVVLDTGEKWNGSIREVMARCDAALAANHALHDHANAALHLAARVFRADGYSRMKYLPAIALGLVCRQKWESGKLMTPTPSEISALGRVKWERVVPSFATKFLPTLMEIIYRRWRSA